MKSFWIALAMYSKLPAKRVEWDKKSLSWALCWFPAVGVAAGALLFGWLWLAGVLGLGAPLRAAVALLIPIAAAVSTWTDSATLPTPWAPTRPGRRSWKSSRTPTPAPSPCSAAECT